jgi:hypothetical protein
MRISSDLWTGLVPSHFRRGAPKGDWLGRTGLELVQGSPHLGRFGFPSLFFVEMFQALTEDILVFDSIHPQALLEKFFRPVRIAATRLPSITRGEASAVAFLQLCDRL